MTLEDVRGIVRQFAAELVEREREFTEVDRPDAAALFTAALACLDDIDTLDLKGLNAAVLEAGLMLKEASL
jgi:hypothetical protein